MARRVRRTAVAVVLLALVAQLLGIEPAASQKVGSALSNVTMTFASGTLNVGSNGFSFVDEGRSPQCSDGSNNDSPQDEATDAPADPECTSALDDSETQSGFQPKQPITANNGTITASGAVSFPQAGVSFPPQYLYADGVGVLTVQIKATAPWTGSLDANNGIMALRMQVEVNVAGVPLAPSCKVGPIDINQMVTGLATGPGPKAPLTGVPYNSSTGRVTMVNTAYSVPASSSCGLAASTLDSTLGLPSSSGNNDATFVGILSPKPAAAIVPAFNVTPGVACRPTQLSGAGSTSVRPISQYQFDDDNDGTAEQSSASTTRSVTFPTAGSRTSSLRVVDADGDGAKVVQTYTVGANLPPTAPNQNLPRSAAGAQVSFTLGGSDPEGGSVTRSIVNQPVNGTLSGSVPNLTYTPNAGFTGPDVITYKVSDDCADSSDTNGTITINVNRNPVADNQTITTNQEIPVNFTLTGTDPDGDALTYSIASTPTHGSLSGSAPALQYTPDPGFNGLDTMTFNVDDGLNGSTSPGTITFNVVKNARPVADPQIVDVDEDNETDITLTGSDADGDTLAFTALTSTTHGLLTGTAPNLHYQPNANFHGSDSFQFSVNDGKGGTNTATVTIDVASVNDDPVANDQTVNLQHDTSKTFTLDAHDDDGDALSYTPLTPVSHGVLTGSFPTFTYQPAPGYIGPDALVYRVSDGTTTDTATVTFNVTPTNQPPVAGSAVVNTNEDTAKGIVLNASDPEGGPIAIAITQDPAHGSLSGTAPNLTYTPAPNYNGADSFKFSVTDDLDQVSVGTITINVLAVNDLPVATPQTVDVTEDTPQSIILSATDGDDAVITYQVVSLPAHGTVTGTAPNVTYTPAANYNGSDSFTFRARDPQGATSTATITLNVVPVNDAPKASNVSKTVAEDASVATPLSATDLDSPSLTYAIVSGPAHGTVGGTGAARTYTPAPNYNGFDTFTYTASDGGLTSNVATVTISVTAVNDAPVAGAQPVLTVAEDSPRPVTLTGSDVDGDSIVFAVSVAPKKGKLTGTVPNLTYTPNPDYNGPDSFQFTVTDPKGLKGTGTITLDVIPAPLIATKVVADPSVVQLGFLGLSVTYPNLRATLSRADGTGPIAGRNLEFWVGTSKICTAVTNTSGVATCKGSGTTTSNPTYEARFLGDADLAPSTGTGTLIK
jgi:hypothetical protein